MGSVIVFPPIGVTRITSRTFVNEISYLIVFVSHLCFIMLVAIGTGKQ